MKPAILLLDEPFGALDEVTREELQFVLLEFYHENLKAKERGDPPPYTNHDCDPRVARGDSGQ